MTSGCICVILCLGLVSAERTKNQGIDDTQYELLTKLINVENGLKS